MTGRFTTFPSFFKELAKKSGSLEYVVKHPRNQNGNTYTIRFDRNALAHRVADEHENMQRRQFARENMASSGTPNDVLNDFVSEGELLREATEAQRAQEAPQESRAPEDYYEGMPDFAEEPAEEPVEERVETRAEIHEVPQTAVTWTPIENSTYREPPRYPL